MCKLSIAVITWNRAKQLVEALESCFACELPQNTEFIIIDNASTDDTAEVVNSLSQQCAFPVYYEKMSENLGVGRGRNYAFSRSRGDYVYFMDDDAYIDKGNLDFFLKAIQYLDENPSIITLTSQIYDLVWKSNRVNRVGPSIKFGLYRLYMFCGGSHFLRKSFWGNSTPYFPNKYGFEEILPSLRVADAGYINAFASDLLVIHNPLKNKWNFNDDKNAELVISELVYQKVIKSNLYPKMCYPLISLVYWCRAKKHLSPERKIRADKQVIAMQGQFEYGERIKVSTVIKLLCNFGLYIF